MSQERTTGGAPKPRRAKPIQPDRPTRGDDGEEPAADGPKMPSAAVDELGAQERTAIENVREGFK